MDTRGNLYGTTFSSGIGNCYSGGCGSVFELSSVAGGGWESRTLYDFLGNLDGAAPSAALVLDSAGNLYGTTATGVGTNCTWTDGGNFSTSLGCGSVFKLTPSSSGSWIETQLYTFPGSDGAWPSGLSADASGNLYGSTWFGGTDGWGEVFQLTPSKQGWSPKTLYSFTGVRDGANPNPVVADAEGNLYGGTFFGGDSTINQGGAGCGVVFKLQSARGSWKETVLHSFPSSPNTDGCVPVGTLVLDSAGNLYGAAQYGGGTCAADGYFGCGIIFELSPTGRGIWAETILHVFPSSSTDGFYPTGSLAFDDAGNLYGTTLSGGNCPGTYGCGTVFEMSRSSNGAWTENVIHNFSTSDNIGLPPNGGLVFDASGNLYGTTVQGGIKSYSQYGCGTVFELSPSGGTWNANALYSFSGSSDGCSPPAGVTFDSSGDLYGTTSFGGSAANCGTTFELSPSSGTWNIRVLHALAGGSDGCNPDAGVALVQGMPYGVTENGGQNAYHLGGGTVFDIVP